MEDVKCIGCGIDIQTSNKDNLGYLPKKVVDEKLDTNQELYCQRCFRMKHYNEGIKVEMSNDDFIKILNEIEKEDSLIVKIVDIFDFSGSFIEGIKRHTGQQDMIVIANKVDLLPRSLKAEKLQEFVYSQLEEYGIEPLDVVLISAQKRYNIDYAIDLIEHYRDGRNVYIVGCTNTGKSSFINALLKSYAGSSKDIITTSILPGTTLDQIRIPLDDDTFIIDTPGVINEHQLAHHVSFDTYKKIMPKKEIKPTTFQLNTYQTVFVGCFVEFNFIKGSNRSPFIFNFARDIVIHRTPYDNKDYFFENHKGEILIPPTKEEAETYEYETRNYKFDGIEKEDLVISGLGFITILKECTIEIKTLKGVGVYKRGAII